MKKIFTLSLILSLTLSIQAQNSVYPDQEYGKLYLVDNDGDNIITVGSCDDIMVTDDYGANWEFLNQPTYSLNTIKYIPDSKGKQAYCLYRSEIKILDIETNTFQDISDDTLNALKDNFKKLFIKGTALYIVDDAGIFRSTIGVHNWERIAEYDFTEGFVMRTDMSDNFIWIGTSTGLLIKIDPNTGVNTELHDFGSRIYRIVMASDDVGYFTKQGGANVYKTTTSGDSIFILENMPETSSPAVYGEDILMTVNTNRIYVSKDGGESAQYHATPNDGLTNLISGHLMTENGTLLMVGHSGMVMETDDLCESFTHLNPFNRENLYSISFNKNGEGFAVGGTRHVVRTTDGGETWSLADFGSTNNDYYNDVVPAGPNRFLMGSTVGIITMENNTYIDTFYGHCNTLINSQVNDDIYAIRYNSGTMLSKTSDFGNTWTDISSLSNNAYRLFQTSSGKLFTTGENRELISSIDDGLTWESVPMQGHDGLVSQFTFMDDDNGLISAGNKLFKTYDGGNTVEEIASSYSVANIFMFSKDHFLYTYASNDLTSIRETMDGGLSWQSTGSYCSPTYGSFYDGDETIWLAQKGGHINMHSILEPSGIPKLNLNKTLSIYPNPVRSGQEIYLDVELTESYKISIFDIAGKIQSLKSINPYTQTIILDQLSPGTYFIEIQTINGNRKTGKLMILE